MRIINGEFLKKLVPNVSGTKKERQDEIIREISDELNPTLLEYEINTNLRIAHFIAQLAHESDGFCTTEEYASGIAYEGRKDLGNTQIGDGRRYKGRGLIELTGRFNYIKFGKILNLPLEEHPCIAAEALISLKIACEYWKELNINTAADTDDIVKVTKLVNGGTNGLDSRKLYYAKAVELFNEPVNETKLVLLTRGSQGDDVRQLQSLLKAKGYSLNVDGDFGKNTYNTVVKFQQSRKLYVDGVVGKDTWDALRS